MATDTVWQSLAGAQGDQATPTKASLSKILGLEQHSIVQRRVPNEHTHSMLVRNSSPADAHATRGSPQALPLVQSVARHIHEDRQSSILG